MPKEGTTGLPLIGVSNQFKAPDDLSPSFSDGETRGEVLEVAMTMGLPESSPE